MTQPTESNSSRSAAPSSKTFRWPLIVVGLLVVHTGSMLVAVVIARSDRSFVAMPNYYERAVRWDKDQADPREGEKLGWNVEVLASPTVDPLGRRAVSFRLTDSAGKPVEKAAMDVRYFHHSHGGQVENLNLPAADPDDPTRFTRLASMRYPGAWEFEFVIQSNGRRAMMTQLVTIQGSRSDDKRSPL